MTVMTVMTSSQSIIWIRTARQQVIWCSFDRTFQIGMTRIRTRLLHQYLVPLYLYCIIYYWNSTNIEYWEFDQTLRPESIPKKEGGWPMRKKPGDSQSWVINPRGVINPQGVINPPGINGWLILIPSVINSCGTGD